MKGFLIRLRALTVKEFRQLLRDKSNLLLGIFLPIILIFIFGYGMSLDVEDAPLALVIEDPAPQTMDALSGLRLSRVFSVRPLTSMRDAQQLLGAHEVDAIVRVPPDFSSRLNAGNAVVQVVVDGTQASRASAIQAYVAGALRQSQMKSFDREGADAAALPAPAVLIDQRIWFNEANTSTWYLVPGLIVLIMTLVGAFLTALVMAREWERGTLEALFVSPVRPAEILLAKVIPYFTVGLLGLGLCLLAAKFLFGVPMRGSLLLLLLGSVLYLIVAVSLGLLISAATKNQFLASQVALLATFLPSLLLSGFLFDLRNVPVAVRIIGEVIPATHFITLVKTLFLAGDVMSIVIRESALLAIYAACLLALARLATGKRLPE
jgi:ABC-2 type transport system permease protein